MITDFEKITKPLDADEKKIAKFIGQYIYKHGRKGKETSNNNLRLAAQSNGFEWLKPARVRAMIHWLRVEKAYKWILANGKGYYYSRNPQDMIRYVTSLSNRVNAIRRVQHSIIIPAKHRQALKDFMSTLPSERKMPAKNQNELRQFIGLQPGDRQPVTYSGKRRTGSKSTATAKKKVKSKKASKVTVEKGNRFKGKTAAQIQKEYNRGIASMHKRWKAKKQK